MENNVLSNNNLSNIIFETSNGNVYSLENTFYDVDTMKLNINGFDGQITMLNNDISNFKTTVVTENNSIKQQLEKIMNKLNKTISLVHNCANCGAQLNIEENKPVFHCKYCGSTYLIGTAQIYSNY